jgi:NAD(P)-dependent dehydrogenase (short-subunit alcohol dehydrogenase family)
MTVRKTIIVTGASRGIGHATALRFHSEGWRVITVSRTPPPGACPWSRERTHILLDLSDLDNVVRCIEIMRDMLGAGALDALVNNAGIVGKSGVRVDEMSAERIQQMMAINVTGAILCAREAVKRMSTKHGGKGGVIVNISSVAAKLGAPNTYVDYAASKGAIDSFTIGLGYEVAAEGIRVAGIRPGLIDTEIHAEGGEPDRAHRLAHMVPMKRVGQAEEIANAIVWLMSDEASYVTSAILDVSGGR